MPLSKDEKNSRGTTLVTFATTAWPQTKITRICSITGAPDEAYWRIARSATLLVKGIILLAARFFQPKEPSLKTTAMKHAVFVIAFEMNDESIAHFIVRARKIAKGAADRMKLLFATMDELRFDPTMQKGPATMNLADLTYNEAGLIPCIVQDTQTGDVLMMAWMNEESIRRTLDEKTTWFWSRSRQKFWHKGEESGNVQKLVDLRYDCDEDTLLAIVEPAGPACHTGERTCFYRSFFSAE